MMKTCIAAILIILSFKVSAQEVLSEESAKLCQDISIQALCASTCAQACSSTEFVDNNFDFCDSTGMLGGESSALPDDPSCAAKFTVTPPLGADPDAVPSSQGELDDSGVTDASTPPKSDADSNSECDALETQFAKRRCKFAKETPACARTVTELEGQSRLLVTQIGLELGKYGELLARDWKDVKNRSLLCAFSEAELERSYNLASKNPDALRALQRQATGVQECQGDWEIWIRERAGNKSSDVLIDVLTRDAEAQLGPLKSQIEGLSTTISKLQNASQTIGEIIDQHIFFCDPNGTPAPVSSEGAP